MSTLISEKCWSTVASQLLFHKYVTTGAKIHISKAFVAPGRQNLGSIPGSMTSAPKQPYMLNPDCPTNIIISKVKELGSTEAPHSETLSRLHTCT